MEPFLQRCFPGIKRVVLSHEWGARIDALISPEGEKLALVNPVCLMVCGGEIKGGGRGEGRGEMKGRDRGEGRGGRQGGEKLALVNPVCLMACACAGGGEVVGRRAAGALDPGEHIEGP